MNSPVRQYDINSERILCAALLFRGKIVAGYRHHSCYETIAHILGIDMKKNMAEFDKILEMPGRAEQGFLTSKDRFVDRAEGFEIALRNDQLLFPYTEGQQRILTSEDLYMNGKEYGG